VLVVVTVGVVKLASKPAAKPVQVVAADMAGAAKQPNEPQGKPVVAEAPAKAGATKPKDSTEKKVQGVKQSSRVRTVVETMGAPAVVSLSVQPWGEILLDNRKQGVSPPLMELQVVEGKHVIEIRNTTFPHVIKNITVKAGEKLKIKHKFANP
jgi:hypothetical protein